MHCHLTTRCQSGFQPKVALNGIMAWHAQSQLNARPQASMEQVRPQASMEQVRPQTSVQNLGGGDCLEIASKGNSSAGCQTKIQRAGWVMLSVKVLLLWFVHSRLIGVSPLTRHPTHADNRRDPTRQGDVNDRGAAHLSHRSLCNLSPSPTQLQHR
jgi:hypothetical protein